MTEPWVEMKVLRDRGSTTAQTGCGGMGARGMTLVNSQVNRDRTIPCSHMGIISRGFQAMAPKTTGSLMFRMPGDHSEIARAFSSRDLAAKHISSTRDKVAPTPPIHR